MSGHFLRSLRKSLKTNGKVTAGADGEQSFTGKKQDGTGLFYFSARFYDPEIGRFLTTDTYTNLPNDERILIGKQGINNILPIGFNGPQEYNRYSYCSNNPIGKTDPDGHFAMALPLVAIGLMLFG